MQAFHFNDSAWSICGNVTAFSSTKSQPNTRGVFAHNRNVQLSLAFAWFLDAMSVCSDAAWQKMNGKSDGCLENSVTAYRLGILDVLLIVSNINMIRDSDLKWCEQVSFK